MKKAQMPRIPNKHSSKSLSPVCFLHRQTLFNTHPKKGKATQAASLHFHFLHFPTILKPDLSSIWKHTSLSANLTSRHLFLPLTQSSIKRPHLGFFFLNSTTDSEWLSSIPFGLHGPIKLKQNETKNRIEIGLPTLILSIMSLKE